MWRFTEVADWFESKRAQSDKILNQWVESSNYSQMVMITAASTKALTTFGAGFVDVLRLGDGIKAGTVSGVATDALRFVAIFPVGKVASLVKSAKGVASAKLVVDTGGPNCFWVASAKALAQIGHKYRGKLFASVEGLSESARHEYDRLMANTQPSRRRRALAKARRESRRGKGDHRDQRYRKDGPF